MRLVLIEPDEPGQDKLLFECVACGQEESVAFRSNGGPRRLALPTGPESPLLKWIGTSRGGLTEAS
jgi:hypothetical protein